MYLNDPNFVDVQKLIITDCRKREFEPQLFYLLLNKVFI